MIIAERREKLAAFDELEQPLRDVIDYGPMNPDSVFPARELQRRHGPARAAQIIRQQIEDAFRGWTPERGSPLWRTWPRAHPDARRVA